MSWDRTIDVINRLKEDDEVLASIEILDPVEHDDLFRDYGLVICPSIVYRDEVISVGPPNFEHVKDKVKELDSKS
jgi:hypothetical protein